ncbi:hypothetical protein MUP01_04615 [Candidatus Bathyarchaeota archaeon]|nr:hypothetical protein [Candidatus Bathyarchaeota archaeon]
MSENSSPWSVILSGVFAALTAIAAYLGTQPLNTLFAVLLGAAVTYSVQKRLQRESEKRSKNAEYVEEYYGPLLIEIQKIQRVILIDVSERYDFGSFEEFKARPQIYTMGGKFSADFLAFSDEIMKFPEKTRYYRDRIRKLICEMGSDFLVNPAGGHRGFVSDLSYSPVSLKYSYESDWFEVSLDSCVLRGKSPIDIVKDKATSFTEESLKVIFHLVVDDGKGGVSNEYDTKSFTERKETLHEILSRVNAELDKDIGYNDFRSELSELRKMAASLSNRLAKYVEKYVSTVDI